MFFRLPSLLLRLAQCSARRSGAVTNAKPPSIAFITSRLRTISRTRSVRFDVRQWPWM